MRNDPPEPNEPSAFDALEEGYAASFYDRADKLGRLLGGGRSYPPIERAKPLDKPVAQFRRKDLWPPAVWAEMQAIQNGDEALSHGVERSVLPSTGELVDILGRYQPSAGRSAALRVEPPSASPAKPAATNAGGRP